MDLPAPSTARRCAWSRHCYRRGYALWQRLSAPDQAELLEIYRSREWSPENLSWVTDVVRREGALSEVGELLACAMAYDEIWGLWRYLLAEGLIGRSGQ
jgi:hypothetical protein